MQFILIIVLVMAVILAIFTIQNSAQVEVAFFIWQADISLALVLLLCVALGVILGGLVSIPGHWRRNQKIKALKQQVRDLEKSHKVPVQETGHKEQPLENSDEALDSEYNLNGQ